MDYLEDLFANASDRQLRQCLALLLGEVNGLIPGDQVRVLAVRILSERTACSPLPMGKGVLVGRDIQVGSIWQRQSDGLLYRVNVVQDGMVGFYRRQDGVTTCVDRRVNDLGDFHWISNPPTAHTFEQAAAAPNEASRCICMQPVAPPGPSHGVRCPMYSFHAKPQLQAAEAKPKQTAEVPHADGTVLHTLWGLAAASPRYDKEKWKTLQREMRGTDASALRLTVARLTKERDEAVAEVTASGIQKRSKLDEELREIDDAILAAGVEPDLGAVTFIRQLATERDEAVTKAKQVEALTARLTELEQRLARIAEKAHDRDDDTHEKRSIRLGECAALAWDHMEEALSTDPLKRRSTLKWAELAKQLAVAEDVLFETTEKLAQAEHQVRTVINRDKSGLAAGLLYVKALAQSYQWIPEGHWGSYEYEQQTIETLRREAGDLIRGVVDGCVRYLRESGLRADAAAKFKLEAKAEPAAETPEVGS